MFFYYVLSSGGKLSKRDPEFSAFGRVAALRESGHLSSAVLSWLLSTGCGFSTSFGACTRSNSDLSIITGVEKSIFSVWWPEMSLTDAITKVRS
ncbi:unnamed protein product [Protopolystoma xenopodis]|uniref:Uncharacterized protein n=1 Tax=Protopolystoma xenopodis TaxID=117903 RepID=A0A3S5CQL0_9PLAT|nr:unnamed protein product [Protopolystoma xenopodis]